MTPTVVCQEGITIPLGEIPPPLPGQATSDCHAPPRLAVVKIVPPTDVTQGSSAGNTPADLLRYEPLSPEATKRV